MVNLKQQNLQLKEKLLKVTSPVERLESDDDQTHLYTGLSSHAVLMSRLTSLSALVPTRSTGCGLQVGDRFLLVLIKLKLAVPYQDLAYWYCNDIMKVSKVFHQWIDIMSRKMQWLVRWPDSELIQQSLCKCVKPKNTNTTFIGDW